MVQPSDKRLVTESKLEDAIDEFVNRPQYKIVPHQISGGLASTALPIDTSVKNQGTSRFPVRFPAPVNRFRVHIRNFSYCDNQGYVGSVKLKNMYWGRAGYSIDSVVDGSFSATPLQIAGEVNLPSNTDDWVSDWVNIPAEQGTEYLLSLGWDASTWDAPVKIVTGWNLSMFNSTAADAGALAPTLTRNEGPNSPFDIWLECEIDSDVPVVGFVGDSITVGDMYTSFPRRYGLAHRIWPVIFGHFGGMLNDWANGSINRLTHFGPIQADAFFVLAGINDVLWGATTNDLKNRSTTLLSRIEANFTSRVFFSTLLPVISTHPDMTTPRNTVRMDHNTWLRNDYRKGFAGVIDLGNIMAQPTDLTWALDRYLNSSDKIHPVSIGHIHIANHIPHLV